MDKNSGLFVSSVAAGVGALLLLSVSACNEHPVDFAQASGSVEHIIVDELGGGHEIDILWMIDNSGSMCRSQQIVRESIDEFLEILTEVNLDFHMGITTTHVADCDDPAYESVCDREPVAMAGHLQATPQPIPGFDPACSHPVYGPNDPEVQNNEDIQPGDPNQAMLDPVIANINSAIECTANPDQWEDLLNFNETELRCALPGSPQVSEDDCEGDMPSLSEFFPPQTAYRNLPVVFRSEDYTDSAGVLDIDRFRRDFGCAALVGTRGYGIERGLDAVVTAVSPELTGGPDATSEDREQFPNAGFIRSTADTGVIFITDENDCSHDGTLNEQTQCGVHNCTIQENLGDQGALTPVEDLYSDFILNLAQSRGASIDMSGSGAQSLAEVEHINQLDPNSPARLGLDQLAQTVLPASLHAPFRRVSPVDSPQSCPDEPWTVSPSCRTEMGRGWSGHRYEFFLRNFPQFFPSADPENPDSPLDGLICHDFSDAIEEIADFFRSEATGCIEDVFPCRGLDDDSCPAHPHTGAEGECVQYPGDSNSYYCDTGVEVRLIPPEEGDANPNALLENTGYCIEGTYDDPAFPGTCVASPSLYRWGRCEGRDAALDLQWVEEEANQILAGFRTITRYASNPIEESADDGGDAEGDETADDDGGSDDGASENEDSAPDEQG